MFGHVDVNISLAKQALADIQGDISELGISEDLHSKEVDAHQHLQSFLDYKSCMLKDQS